ncbi:MAG: thrombospondin type 3 repeat-containing protein [Pseudomonadota bacterium]
MNRKTLLFSTLLGLSAVSATAADVTYELTFDRIAGDSGTATALMTIDDATLTNGGVPARLSYSTATGFPGLRSFNLEVRDTGMFDGNYGLNFIRLTLNFDAPLNPAQELLQQDTAIGPGNDFSLALFSPEIFANLDVNTFGRIDRDEQGAIEDQAVFRLTAVTPLNAPTDSDGDGVTDEADNCVALANPDQFDFDEDGYGNACDADFNNDCVVNIVDLGTMRQFFFTESGLTDLNGDGTTNVVDLGILRAQFFLAPGPSGVTSDCD